MKLYHGSDIEIDKVDLTKCMPYKDFGQGFYTTVLLEQAWRMAERRARINDGVPIVTIFEVPDDLVTKAELRCRVFDEKPSVEWAIFIRNNRDREFCDEASMECNLDSKYDVVVGPVANDTVGLLIRQFSRGTIDADYIRYLVEDTGMTMEQAMKRFYLSETFKKLVDPETGLYLEGSSYVYEMFKNSLNDNSI